MADKVIVPKPATMYIQSAYISNIRSIRELRLDFSRQMPGWHVLIGDNGAGKSSVVRSLAALLVGPHEIQALLPVWEEWLTREETFGLIEATLVKDPNWDAVDIPSRTKAQIVNRYKLLRQGWNKVRLEVNLNHPDEQPGLYNWGNNSGWFSAAYGPFRRFTGGDPSNAKIYKSAERAGAHLSAFREDVALTEALDWLKELDFRRLKSEEFKKIKQVREPEGGYEDPDTRLFRRLKTFLNASGLLPHGTRFEGINQDGQVQFTDGNGQTIPVLSMSDGYRSMLSMTFELIRQLVRVYGEQVVFRDVPDSETDVAETPCTIDLPGVVLIDEIDVHLHPTWQTRVGHWFTEHFPALQFIVTTHSPLVCRACDRGGTIWRLRAPGSDQPSGEVTGLDRERLIYGNILDAYGTELFGDTPVRSETSNDMLERLGHLNMLKVVGKIGKEEERERIHLQQILSTDAPHS